MVEVRIQVDKKTIIQISIKTDDVIQAINMALEKHPKGKILSAIYFKK